MCLGHEQVGYLVVVATSAAQSTNIPSIDDFRFVGREERYGRLTRAIWAEARPISIVHNAAAQYPFAMVDAAAVCPATGHAVAPVHDFDLS